MVEISQVVVCCSLDTSEQPMQSVILSVAYAFDAPYDTRFPDN